MKIGHLILAHSEPLHLERLINRLKHENAYFFIHIDKKVSIEPFRFLAQMERVFLLTRREKVSWGAYSIVQATINGFDAIMKSGQGIELVNLLSGSDYPLKSAEEVDHFFEEHHGKNFMQYELVYQDWQEAITRLTEYHLTNYSFPGKYVVQKWLNKLAPTRKMPGKLTPVGRSQWMTITIEAVAYILDYLDKHGEVVRFFKFTWAPAEIVFQTILYNSSFRGTMVNNHLRYMDWSEGKASPKTLSEQDLPNLLDSDALFARKFSSHTHPEVLAMLDQLVRKATD